MRFGVLAHDLKKGTAAEVAATVASYGLQFVQLALAKALTDVDSSLGRLSTGLANHIAEAFERERVRISVLGCYINPIDPDPAARRYAIDRFKEHIRYARDFGASLVATETGNVADYRKARPDATDDELWQLLRSAVEEMAEEAERWGVHVGIEASPTEVIHTSDLMARLLEEVPSRNIGVVFDPCHLLNAQNIGRQREVLDRAFEQFGDRIALGHVKDLAFDEAGVKRYVKMGTGELDYPYFLGRLQKLKPHLNLSFEGGIKPDHVADSIAYLQGVLKSL